MALSIDDATKRDLKTFAALTGKPMARIIREALAESLAPYRNENGVLNPLPGLFTEAFSSYMEQVGASSKPKRCYVLRERMMYGQPHYVIYCDGRLMTVPERSVELQKL